MDFVTDRLALGNAADAAGPPAAVTALLCVAAELDAPPAGLRFHKVPIIDFRPIPAPLLAEAVDWIEAQGPAERVLVYCNAGVGRSTSVVVAHLCVAQGMGFGQAVEFVARRRPHMSILPGLLTAIDRVRASRQR
ncbi:dual specificity protein phosphatase [Sulfurifustis variabilis]|uniref:Dual specificity protein phosphatase n=1 Tax=Sulfurifustis variabilis TaxID=1675686 RepID=A0A1B4V0Z5_9GAMM|nr:dual specificity protein phosphatase [Sulfurifustis variabilis]BAU46895.1 dual specificity protein phosphatase [Sulfurifustis variabilis]